MRNKFFLWIILLVLSTNIAFAKGITISLNQTEYYFLVNEQAVVPFYIDNTYKKQIDGTLTYTIAQEINQQGFQYSSSSAQSTPFIIMEDENTYNLAFGTSPSQLTLKADLSFSYTEKQEREVDIDEILIHFVQDPSQKQNQEDKTKSKSKKSKSQEEKSIAQQMQERLDQMFNKPKPQDPRQMLQNNQLAQDSAALKQQIQKQLQEQQKMTEEFQKQITDNPNFQKEHQDLTNQGYKQTSGNLDPINNTSGNFEINYEKDSETASLKGEMENSEITKMQKTSSVETKKMLEELKQDPKFQEYNQQLTNNNFSEGSPKIEQVGNTTKVEIPYTKKNQTATIKAVIENNEIKEIKLEKEKKNYWWISAIILIAIIAPYLIYKRYIKKKNLESSKNNIVEKPIDYKKESLKLIQDSKTLFKNKKEKDAYTKAGEAIRFYYSYKLGLKKELTNTELTKQLKKNNISYQKTQECINLCGLVGFAKYKTNKKDFDDIVNLAEKIIK
ncbi:MAG: hypothetical protein U9O94_03855 [Nanoarchaeota archaeon]|nr:hypothetical protein [Nanoarchaeota archaeon]